MWLIFMGIAWAGMVLMPLVGILPGLCVVFIGTLLSALAEEEKNYRLQSKEKRKLAQYPSYKYQRR